MFNYHVNNYFSDAKFSFGKAALLCKNSNITPIVIYESAGLNI